MLLGLWTTMLLASLAGFVVLAVERGERVQADRALVSLIAREAAARTLFWLMRPIGVVHSQPVRAPVDAAERTTPVLLVSGSSVNRAAFAFLRTFLVQRGFAWVWACHPGHESLGLVDGAAELGRSVRQLIEASGSSQLDIVGFGSGGLVAAWYARHLDDDGRVRRLVTLGTPWRGTKLSVFRRGRLAEDMMFGAHLLDDLAPPVPTVSVFSRFDPTVIPSDSACPPDLQTVEIERAGHADMLISARVFRAVQAALV